MIKHTIQKLFQRSRLDQYRSLLQLALDKGYIITSLIDWYKHDFYPDKKILILRHDIDSDTEGAYKMYLIEKELGVKSTYYFRWSTMRQDIMKQMHIDDFEVSLHFETLASYCIQHKIISQKQITSDIFDKCLEILKREIITFKNKYWEISSICSHGDKRNRQLKIPNHRIIENIPRSDLNILFEAYDSNIINNFDLYTSDSSVKNNFQWKNGMDPQDAIMKGRQTICMLTHPRHWNFSIRKKLRSIIVDIREKLS